MIKCNVCGKEDPKYLWRCEEHYKCDDCGTKEGLVTRTTGVVCNNCHSKRMEKKIAEFDGQVDYTPEIVCPWCGFEHSDSFECDDEDDAFECSECEKSFKMVRDVEVSYCTSRGI